MIIHIVEPDDTLISISRQYNIPVSRIISDNGLDESGELVLGQALVILTPVQTYTVNLGDTIEGISKMYNISTMQLYRNNRFLLSQNSLIPGETLVISYANSNGPLHTFGYSNTYIDIDFLQRTLPYMTYYLIHGNYFTKDADIIEANDENLIKVTISYGTIPLMILSSVISQEAKNSDDTYFLLTDPGLTTKLISNIVSVLKNKGYYGLNFVVEFLNPYNFQIYQDFIKNISVILKAENLQIFITVSPGSTRLSSDNVQKIYSDIDDYVDGIIFMDYNRGLDLYSPPMPLTSIPRMQDFLQTAVHIINNNIISIGCPVIGFDWQLPYIPYESDLNILKYNTVIELAYTQNVAISFDATSQTPYFKYSQQTNNIPTEHIVWFIDARTIQALAYLIEEFDLIGAGAWNIMYFFAPMWSILNSEFKIEKLLPENTPITTQTLISHFST